MRSERYRIVATCLASTFWTGYFPIAPGTVGSVIAIIALCLLPVLPWWLLLSVAIAGFFIGVWASQQAENVWGYDAGRINWDEVIGMLVSIIALPKTWIVYLAAFMLFRLLDIVKPFPANASQKLPGGWGVMTDDVIAAVYCNLALQIVFRLII